MNSDRDKPACGIGPDPYSDMLAKQAADRAQQMANSALDTRIGSFESRPDFSGQPPPPSTRILDQRYAGNDTRPSLSSMRDQLHENTAPPRQPLLPDIGTIVSDTCALLADAQQALSAAASRVGADFQLPSEAVSNEHKPQSEGDEVRARARTARNMAAEVLRLATIVNGSI